jgi:hypothetical protein
MQYKCWRSWPTVELHLICNAFGFDDLPHKVRTLGPWTGSHKGDLQNLKPHYRRLLAEQGFVIIWSKPSAFSPEHA